jgi:hypothetical protein
MNLTSLATNALATTRSTFKGLADAAVATGANPEAEQPAAPVPAQAAAPEVAEASAPKPKGVRLGTVLDAYA